MLSNITHPIKCGQYSPRTDAAASQVSQVSKANETLKAVAVMYSVYIHMYIRIISYKELDMNAL